MCAWTFAAGEGGEPQQGELRLKTTTLVQTPTLVRIPTPIQRLQPYSIPLLNTLI